MKSYVLEAIGEAIAYPLSNDPSEKAEFYEKLDQFDTSAAEFVMIAHIGQLGQEEETELFNQMVTAKESLANQGGRGAAPYSGSDPYLLRGGERYRPGRR